MFVWVGYKHFAPPEQEQVAPEKHAPPEQEQVAPEKHALSE